MTARFFNKILLIASALFLLLPLASIFQAIGDWSAPFAWGQLASYSLNSFIITISVMFFTLVIGVSTAWCVTFYHFPAGKIIRYLLIFPLAFPAYITAFIYGYLLEYAGPVQTMLRGIFTLEKGEYLFPQIRSMTGAVFVLTLVLYPYIYLLAKTAMAKNGALLNVAKTMKLSKWQFFSHIGIRSITPALIGGSILVMMESLAEFGAMQYLAVDTYTTAIYRHWFMQGNPLWAAKLSAILLLIVLTLLWIEKRCKSYSAFATTNHFGHNIERKKITGIKAWGVFTLCAIPVLLGALIPLFQLLYWAVDHIPNIDIGFFAALVNKSFFTAFLAALLTVMIALWYNSFWRSSYSGLTRKVTGLTTLGYAVPGTVIAIALLWMFGWIDAQRYHVLGGAKVTVLTGTFFAIIVAYVIRFLALALQTIESGYSKIHRETDDAAILLGKSPWQILRYIHVPQLWPSLSVAVILVFIETMKELPATLILRPFNFETLATYTYQLASDERPEEAAIYGFLLVMLSLGPVWWLSREQKHAKFME